MKGFKNINEFTLAECQNFLQRNDKDSALCEHVYARMESLLREQREMDDDMFSSCRTFENYQEYNSKYPNGRHIDESKQIIERLIWEKHSQSRKLCQSYISNYSNGTYIEEARKKLSEYQEKKKKEKIWGFIALVLPFILFVLWWYNGPAILDPEHTHQMYGTEEYSSDNGETIEYDTCVVDEAVQDSVVW